MSQIYEIKKEEIRAEILKAAQKYKSELLGKSFVYIYENKCIEIMFRKAAFSHLTGVKTYLNANDFFKKAINGELKRNHIFFDQNHPMKTAMKKVKQLANLEKITTEKVYIMEDIQTQTVVYEKSVSDKKINLMLNKANKTFYFPQSLRVGGKRIYEENKIYPVQFILSKEINQKQYGCLRYGNKDELLKYVKNNEIDIEIDKNFYEN